jgi:hypothetical protein
MQDAECTGTAAGAEMNSRFNLIATLQQVLQGTFRLNLIDNPVE